MFFHARKLLKAHKVHAAWTQNGNVLIRKSEGDDVKQICNYDDFRDMQDQEYELSLMSPDSNRSDDVPSYMSDFSY